MPPDEPNNAARSCDRHPGAAVVASCDTCGRALCLRCAVPVRGKTFGDECLAELLGPDLVPTPPPPARWRRPVLVPAGVGFAIAIVASALPWQRFGQGAGFLGAYALAPRYSLACAILAIAGGLVWASVIARSSRPGRWWLIAMRMCAVLVIVTAALHILRPPSIGPASIGPWVAILGGAIALAGTFAHERSRSPAPAGSR